MKTFNLNKKSWHFWLAQKYGGLWYCTGDKLDICRYSRKVLKGLLAFLFLLAGLSAFGFLYLFSGYEFFACVFDDACVKIPEISLVFISVNIGISAILALGFGAMGIDKYRDYRAIHPTEKKEPGFLTLLYRKIKDKTCFMVDIK